MRYPAMEGESKVTDGTQLAADIVLLTVNKHEQAQLTAVLEHDLRRNLVPLQGDSNEVYLDAGEINGQRVMVAKSLIGSTGSGASFDTVSNILDDLSPQVIIAVGIAWGAKNADGQQIGDILLSTRLRDAQHHKATPDNITPRGPIEATDGTLLKTFLAAADQSGKRAHEGLLISIETLFDDEQHRDKFIAADHHLPIGGEMEGSGLLMSLRRAKDRRVDWLVVKAICDWGFNKNEDSLKKEQDQLMAARNASELCVFTISHFRLVQKAVRSRRAPGAGGATLAQPAQDAAGNARATAADNGAVQLLPTERSIAKTVQVYISKNSSFTLDVGFPIMRREWSEKLVFELYKLTEELGSTKYFLYVHEGASQSGTLVYLRTNNLVKKDIPLIVLTEKPSALKESERRKDNLRAVFGTDNVYFIDDFGRQFLYKEHIQGFAPYNLPVYVESLTETGMSGTSESALHQLKSWYASISAPLMVVKGHGGIGKTTLVKQFLDEIHSTNPETGILFIDSHEIIGELETIIRSRQKIDDIYDFYHAQSVTQSADNKSFSKDLLSLSVDNGSLVIVLDGIDEVIAKLGAKFDAVSFINSISTIYSTNLQRAKIIITCRDYFWDSLQNVGPVAQIDLQPFNRSMAEEFFRKSLDAQAKVEKALTIAHKFAIRSQEQAGEVFVPYILDLIVYLIKQKTEFGDEPLSLTDVGSLLNPKLPNDFLVASVCQREIAKLHSLPVESQIEFFVRLSVAKDGHVSVYDLKALLGSLHSQGEQIGDDTIERLKGHPLLVQRDNKLYFRYDFFNEYFNSLYIVKYFSARNVDSSRTDFVEVAADYLRFDGEFMRTVCERLILDDELVLFGIETVERLREDLPLLDARSRYKGLRACSAVFCLFLSLMRESAKIKFDVDTCTNLLKDFFGKDGEIHGLSLINVGSNSAAKPIFDFRGQRLRDCYFEGYDFFWECLLDSGTRFYDSTFKSLEPRKDVRPNFYERTFDERCDTSGIAHLLTKKIESASQHITEVREDLLRFFRLFYTRGNFYPQKQEYIRGKFFAGTYLPVLLKNRVIEDFVDPQKATIRQYRVTAAFAPIVKHIEQGGPCIELDRVAYLFAK